MKVRSDHAGTVACIIALQLFALAVFFSMYALIAGRAFYSLSEQTGKIICIATASAISAGLVVVNIMCSIRSQKVYITKPDSIAIREGSEVVRMAYITARPVLIYKITAAMVIMTISGLVYIMILIFVDDKALAGLYGRIAVCLFTAGAALIAWPCLDRISCYRALLGETHEMYIDTRPARALMYIASFAVPLSVCGWYIWRYYMNVSEIAWIVFPVTALFSMAGAFLAGWTADKVPE